MSTSMALVTVLTGVVMIAWIIWGVREYRRTGKATWLWMAAVMGISVLVGLSRVL